MSKDNRNPIEKTILHAGTKVVEFSPGTKVKLWHNYLLSVLDLIVIDFFRWCFTLIRRNVMVIKLSLMIVESWGNQWNWYWEKNSS